jgi:anti-anti-sigma regulatory factor
MEHGSKPYGASSLAAGEPFSWRVVRRDGDRLYVELRGEIDENADFSELRHSLRGEVELGLEGVTRINSCGVREWVNFVRGLTQVRKLTFTRCSPPVVLQINNIFNFRGRAQVVSFMAPYVCEMCRADEYKLLIVSEHFPNRTSNVPGFLCRRCGGVMVLDELPERYLSFLLEGELAAPPAPGAKKPVGS